MNSETSVHVVTVNLAVEIEDVASYGAEPDVMDVNLPFNWTALVRPFEISRDSVSVLLDLEVLDDDLVIVDVIGVNRPASFDVVWWLLCPRDVANDQRQENKARQP